MSRCDAVVGCTGALLGNRVAYWLDPTIAMVLSMWLIWAWGRQALENIMALIGMSASPEQLQKLTYLCCNHSSQITKIDTVRCGNVKRCARLGAACTRIAMPWLCNEPGCRRCAMAC